MPIPWAIKCLKDGYCFKKNQSLKARFADWFIGLKAEKDLQLILPFLKGKSKKNLKIIDIGAGSGGLACRLLRQGFKELVCLDVKNLSLCSHCGQPKKPHFICPSCGYYDNKEIVKVSGEKS